MSIDDLERRSRVGSRALGITVVVTALGFALLARAGWAELGRWNPTFREPATWTAADLEKVFFEPDLHWSGPRHGCRHWPFSPRCKGSPVVAVRALERRRDAATEGVMPRVVLAARPHVARFAAEACGVWKLRAAEPALRARLRELSVSDTRWHTDEERAIWSIAWALEQLGANDAVLELRCARENGNPFVEHSLAVLESRIQCDGCGPPSRK